jgi:dipeptidyl aminopeptidase/acylaminoacyl peptidase
MRRDLRETPLYREVEAFYRSALEPGFGRISDARDPQPSPDGRWVAFTGEVLDRLEGHGSTRICLAAADGSGWRTVTSGPNDDAGARWSPDGRTLTFLSDRAVPGRMQLYALDAEGIGEARPLPAVPGVVEHHRWSPDGERILLIVAGEGAEQADALGSGTLGPETELPSWVPDVESWHDADEWRSLWILDIRSDRARRVSAEGLNVWEATWVGDDSIVGIVSDAPGEGAWYTAALAAIDLGTGRERILHRGDAQLQFAEGAPGGSLVAVVEAVASDRYVLAGDLLLVDVDSGSVLRVEVGADVSSARWRGQRLLAAALDRLDAVVLDVDRQGRARELWRTAEAVGGYQPEAAPLGDGDAFACVRSSAHRPPEVVAVDGNVRTLASLRHPGHDAMLAHVGGRRRLTWTAPDGLEIDGLLTMPPGEGPFPLILDVHGGPIGAVTDGWPSVATSLLLARGYASLAPNPRGSSGRGRAFAAMVVADMGGADALDDLAGVDAVIDAGVADPERLAVMGGSYGGFMAAWLPTLDDRFRAAIAISPVTDWYSEHYGSSLIDWVGDFLGADPDTPGGDHHARSPVFAGERLCTPTLLTAGLRDRATPPGQAVEMYRALRARGVPAEVALYPMEGHGVRDLPAGLDLVTRIVAWLDRFVTAP